jgi:hypothetical protein
VHLKHSRDRAEGFKRNVGRFSLYAPHVIPRHERGGAKLFLRKLGSKSRGSEVRCQIRSKFLIEGRQGSPYAFSGCGHSSAESLYAWNSNSLSEPVAATVCATTPSFPQPKVQVLLTS